LRNSEKLGLLLPALLRALEHGEQEMTMRPITIQRARFL